jgi:hypothetical protein
MTAQVKEAALSRRAELGSLLKEAFVLDQLRDQILWTSQGEAKRLTEEAKATLAALNEKSARVKARLQELTLG